MPKIHDVCNSLVEQLSPKGPGLILVILLQLFFFYSITLFGIHLNERVLELRLYHCLCQQILRGLSDSDFQQWGVGAFHHFYSICLTFVLPWGTEKKAKKWKNYSPIWIDDTTSVLLKFWHWNIKKRENLIVFCKVKEYNLLCIFCLKMKHSPSVSSFILSPNMPFTSLPMLFIPNSPPAVPSPSLGVVEWLALPLVWWTISHQEMDQALHFYDFSKTISLKQ